MPVIEVYSERLARFLGIDVDLKQLIRDLPWLATDIEDVGDNFVKIEYNPNRPDFSSHPGLARAYAGFLEIKLGYPEVRVTEPKIDFYFNEELKDIRGVLCSAVVRNIQLSEDDLKEIITIQEVLHQGIGRNRRKVSIGIHDLDKIRPPIYYIAADPEKTSFKPLGMDRVMTLNQILNEIDKGVEYGHIIKSFDKYPLIIDSTGEVLSFPPIINSELTRLTPETKNLFIDVTALDEYYASRALNILLYALSDIGGSIEAVRIIYQDGSMKTYPDFKPREISVEASYINSLLGENLENTEIYRSLLKCRFSVKNNGESFRVGIPPYRVDVMHKVDLVEEVAIGYGLWKLTPTFPKSVTIGSKHPETILQDKVKMIMIGLGYTEVFNFVITSEEKNYHRVRRPVTNRIVLANSSSTELTMLRDSLLPCLILNLSVSKHEKYPQRIFETGPIVKAGGDKGFSIRLSIAGVSAHSSASFSEIKAVVLVLLNSLGVEKIRFEKGDDPLFTPGRVANVFYEDKLIGVLGEIHPEVIELNNLENPVVGFEMELDTFINKCSKP
ncbi:MAG: phenylalanine--tRNA ligase subunit beta [Crenarchaeota archaeon]|nr:phenylalanine--tRNA ligase subunit beta [Thermoproteota archaeon]MDW8034369.1 phenylalanine--tRNA ligase subunit beta [Nitrososphaerota archaeon]